MKFHVQPSRLLDQAVYHDNSSCQNRYKQPWIRDNVSRLDDKGPLQDSEGIANDHRHYERHESGNHNPTNERADQQGYQLSSTRITVTGNILHVWVCNGASCACRKLRLRLAGGIEYMKIGIRRVVNRKRETEKRREKGKERGRGREREERDLWTGSAENWCIPYAKQQKHGASSSWTARNRESSTVSLYSVLSPRPSFSPLVRLAFYHHQRLRHLRPEQNRERYRSN